MLHEDYDHKDSVPKKEKEKGSLFITISTPSNVPRYAIFRVDRAP
jgi:hypothetical protein